MKRCILCGIWFEGQFCPNCSRKSKKKPYSNGKAALFLLVMMFTITLFCLNFASAGLTDSVEAKDFIINEPITIGVSQIDYTPLWEKYQPVQIKSWWGLPLISETIEEGAITEHTESCLEDCHSIIQIATYRDSALVDSIKFETIRDDKTRVEQPIRSYQFYIQTGKNEKEVNDYEWQCIEGTKLLNGTIPQTCSNVLIGKHIEEISIWKEYSIGEILPAGEYTLKIEGKKKPGRTVDWIITSQGKEINEWAAWGGFGSSVWNNISNSAALQGFSNADMTGMTFTPLVAGTLKKMTRINGATCNTSYLIDSATGVNILNGSAFTDDNSTFNDYLLTVGKNYSIVCDSQGSAFTREYYRPGPPIGYPVTATNIVWTSGWDESSGLPQKAVVGDIMNVLGIDFAPSSEAINLSSPVQGYNSSSKTIVFNCSATPTAPATLVNISLLHNATGTLEINKTNEATGTSNSTIFSINFGDGSYNWSCLACDSDGDCGSGENRTIMIDTIAPTINIFYPNGTINGLANGQSLGLNFSIIHPASNITSCGYEYNGANTSIANCYGNTTFTYVTGKNSIIVWANDTLGNYNHSSSNWSVPIIINSITYSPTTTSGALETFSMNITASKSVSYANLIYKTTSYSAAVSIINSTDSIISKQINVPITTTDSNNSFYFNIYFNDGTNYNTSNYYQLVSPIYFQICNNTINTPFINFTTKNVVTPFTDINSSIKATWYLGAIGLKQNYSYEDSIGNKSSFAFCSNNNNSVLADAIIEYSSPGYANNIYYINNLTLNNNTQRINLYLLNNTLATLTVINVVNTAQFPQEGITVKAQAYDIGNNNYSDAAMGKTDFNGNAPMYLNWYDTQYRFILIRNYQTIKTTNNTQITATPVVITLDSTTTFTFDKFENFQYTLNWNNITKIFTLTFTKPSDLVDTGCLRVIKRTAKEDTQLCLNCETANSATIICDISNQTNGTYIAAFYATGSFKLIDWITASIGIGMGEDIYYALGNEDATFYAFIFSGICMTMFFIHPVFAIIGLILGMIGGAALGFTLVNYSIFIGITIVGGLIIWLLKR